MDFLFPLMDCHDWSEASASVSWYIGTTANCKVLWCSGLGCPGDKQACAIFYRNKPFPQQRGIIMLMPIPIPSLIDSQPIPAKWMDKLETVNLRIQAFQDRWDRPQIEQFVAADFSHVFQAIEWIRATQPLMGNRFLEWGCGFAVVTSIAAAFNFDSIGIEAEPDLIDQGRSTLLDWEVSAELFEGNFLPTNAERLAHQASLPSLGHPKKSAYDKIGLELDDFSFVYSYPWPGEDQFHRAVFDRFAAPGALLLCFCGPNDLQLHRKLSPPPPSRSEQRSSKQRRRRRC
ncbi:class I SAM-dependent methyltransferase [bacterium]|nr:class I SAM-dependent methyltransferase [bacterium]